MKKYTIMLLILVLSCISNNAFAGLESETYEKQPVTKMEDRAVIAHDFDFSVEEEGGMVTAKWNKFDGEGFEWFKLVYSSTNSKPVYPTDKTVFVGNKNQLTKTFKLDKGSSKHYVRICALVLNDDYSKDRYCSEVKSIEATVVEYKKDYEKKEYVKKDYEKKTYLSKNVQERVDIVIENFINRLKDKGFSDAKMVETIDIVLERLEKRKEDAKYEVLISYMESALAKHRADYDAGLGDLEGIFSDF
jgi:hypothetical protein